MADIITYPENGITYDADDASGFLSTRLSGVYSAEEDFAVTAQGGLSITVSAGQAWVRPARFKGRSIIMEQPTTVVLTEADPVRSRIDRIVLRYDAAAKKTRLQVLDGTPDSASPAAPAITRTELIYDLCLAEITRPAGSTAVTTGQITDTRLDEKLCGIVRDGVTGIPTDELLAAARERINALEEKATSSAAAAKDSAEAAKSSETKSAASEKNAKTSETAAKQILMDTQNAVKTVTANMNAAAGSASTAATKAGEAEKSKTAAATSATNAKASEEASKNWAEEAKKAANTDPTVSIKGAPADAAATRALIKETLAQQREEDNSKIKFWASNDPTSPASFIGGTWERIEGEFIMGASDAYPAGTTGGSATHTQTVAEMPSHNHSGSTGSAGSHSHSAWTGGAGGHNHTVSAAITNKNGPMMASENSGYGQYADNGTPTTSWVGDHTHGVGMNEAGAHTHTVSIGSTGSGQAMSILNPYHSLYIWVRVDDAA